MSKTIDYLSLINRGCQCFHLSGLPEDMVFLWDEQNEVIVKMNAVLLNNILKTNVSDIIQFIKSSHT